ncbi:MAG: hypothetical protein K9K82_06665 [Desulfobacteraceae bacterium]|nr:hypothetical protein [Desulfobacteraceae bacterium]
MLFLQAQAALALEKLSNKEMRTITGQAGISAAVDNGVMVIYSPLVTIRGVNTKDRYGNDLDIDGHMSFKTSAFLSIQEAFDIDIGRPYGGEELTFTDHTAGGEVLRTFSHPLSDLAMIALSQASDDPTYILNKENIAVYNHALDEMSQIGDFSLYGLNAMESRANFFPYGSGLRTVAGIRAQVEGLVLENPNQQKTASATGIMIGAAFEGEALPEGPSSTNELDTSTWSFAEGLFEFGIPYYYHDDPDQEDTEINSYPFTLDITGDETRSGDFQTYMAVKAPIRGSIRIKNVESSNFDMGAIAIDGIRLYKNYIEFPGRGIGN